MSSLTVTLSGKLLDLITGNAAFAPQLPLHLALVTELGDDATPGIEVAGGGYGRQVVTFGPQANKVARNNAAFGFTAMPEISVVGGELYDDSGLRMLYGPFSKIINCNDGDDIPFDVGALALTIA
ncbi:phage tail fiber protein [Actinomadura violacea]|uniref:Uncharacterized protein n=1 Tax=Actinomadura violacea TaxID=2819934 RepID=A0ABS3RWQ6_9ACTN|nr:hypothetical protein [Actinomadura violacea]MBO2461194.1 hypothetical protein [Actinomadura violacea]